MVQKKRLGEKGENYDFDYMNQQGKNWQGYLEKAGSYKG